MTASAIQPAGDGLELRRAAMVRELRSLQSLCRGLYALLPEAEPWRGAASNAYRQRLASLREGLDAAHAALTAAEGVL